MAFLGFDSEDIYCFWRAEGGLIVGNLVPSRAEEIINLRGVVVDHVLCTVFWRKNLLLCPLIVKSAGFIREICLKDEQDN